MATYIVEVSSIVPKPNQIQIGFGLSSNQVEIQQVSPLPSPPLTGLRAWYKADSIVASSGSSVSLWSDSSGNGFNLTQSSVSNQPLLDTAAINSQAALRFNGSSVQYFFVPNMFSTMVAGQIFLVLSGIGQGISFEGIWSFPHTSDNENYPWVDGNIYDGALRTNRAGPIAPGSPSINSWHTYEIISTSSEYTLLRTSNQIFTTGTNTFNTTGTPRTLGYSNNAYPFNGWMAELIFYDHKVTTSDRNAIVSYLRTKYGGSII